MDSHAYVLFITGNPGVGKSFIANHLGANFVSGFSEYGGGVTTHVQTESVNIRGRRVLLVDAPGMFDRDIETTQKNAREITKALKISEGTPLKIGVVIQDHNGRIQHSDLLLIKKVHEALTPQFEMFIIVNQVKERNMAMFANPDCIENLAQTIHQKTQAIVSVDRIIVIADFDGDDDDTIDLAILTNMLESIAQQYVQHVDDVYVAHEEFQSLQDMLYVALNAFVAGEGPIWRIPWMIFKVVKQQRRAKAQTESA